MIVDQSIRDLQIILVTERCDMSYDISYFTQENVFIVAEIVFQSSCTKSWEGDQNYLSRFGHPSTKQVRDGRGG